MNEYEQLKLQISCNDGKHMQWEQKQNDAKCMYEAEKSVTKELSGKIKYIEEQLNCSEYENNRIFKKMLETDDILTKAFNDSHHLAEVMAQSVEEFKSTSKSQDDIQNTLSVFTDENKSLIQDVNSILNSCKTVLADQSAKENQLSNELEYTRSRMFYQSSAVDSRMASVQTIIDGFYEKQDEIKETLEANLKTARDITVTDNNEIIQCWINLYQVERANRVSDKLWE